MQHGGETRALRVANSGAASWKLHSSLDAFPEIPLYSRHIGARISGVSLYPERGGTVSIPFRGSVPRNPEPHADNATDGNSHLASSPIEISSTPYDVILTRQKPGIKRM